jgi:hypothetical protein
MSLLDRLRPDRMRPSDLASERPQPDLPDPEPAEGAPAEGRWSGLLFDNPAIGLEARLTWTFSFATQDVPRGDGPSEVDFTVDWVPLPGAVWTSMAGRTARGEIFAEPIETSAYALEHFRYDAVDLRVLEQAGDRLRVSAEAHGDVDGLGVEGWNVDGWLAFDGITVHLSDVTTGEQAYARLSALTDTAGLVAVPSEPSFRFAPAPPPPAH